MAGDTKTAWKFRVGAEIASLQLENLAAAVAAEVMMMRLAGDLIAQGFAGHGDCCKPVTFQQRTDVAVHGGDA